MKLAPLLLITVAAATERRGEPRDQARQQRHAHTYCTTCARNANGRIKRSSTARRAFQHAHPCPSTGSTSGACPGYIIDHVIPLKRGGPDTPENMQWQSQEEAATKDKSE